MITGTVWKKMIFAGLTVVLCMGLLEICFRGVERLSQTVETVPKAYLRPALQPVNETGLRKKFLNTYRDRDENRYRIVCMGDSVTHGFRMARDETYPAKLETRLADVTVSGRQIQVINAGVVGTSLVQGLKYYRDTIRQLKPDMIIAAYGINDHFYNPTPDIERVRIAPAPAVRFQQLFRKSAVYRVMRHHLRESKVPAELKSVRVSPREFQRFLKRFHSELSEDGVELVLMNSLSANYDMVLLEYSRFMADYARENQVPFIDLYRNFGEYAGIKVDFYGGDIILYKSEQIRLVEPLEMTNTEVEFFFIDAYHPTARGYDVIAGLVADQLQVKIWEK